MKKNLLFLLLFVSSFITSSLSAQVSIFSRVEEPSAILNITTNPAKPKGFLLPGIDTLTLNEIRDPAEYLLVFQKTGNPNGFAFYKTFDLGGGFTEGRWVKLRLPDIIALDIDEGLIKSSSILDGSLISVLFAKNSLDSLVVLDSMVTKDDLADGSIINRHFRNDFKVDHNLHLSSNSFFLNDRDILLWDDSDKMWEVSSILRTPVLAGKWSPSTNTPTISDSDNVKDGTHYIAKGDDATVNLGSGNMSFSKGDLAIYDDGKWNKIDSVVSTFSFEDRIGNLEAQDGDYAFTLIGGFNEFLLEHIGDVRRETAVMGGELLKYNSSIMSFESQIDKGSSLDKINQYGFSVKSVDSRAVKSRGITTNKIQDTAVGREHITPSTINSSNIGEGTISTSHLSSIKSGVTKRHYDLKYNSTLDKFQISERPTVPVFLGEWDPVDNEPFASQIDSVNDVAFGSFYSIKRNGSQFGVSFKENDLAMYSKVGWVNLPTSSGVTDFNNRRISSSGLIDTASGDYSWQLIGYNNSRISNLLPSLANMTNGQLIRLDTNAMQWVPQEDIGSENMQLDSDGILDSTLSSTYIKDGSIDPMFEVVDSAILEIHISPEAISTNHITEVNRNVFAKQSVSDRHLDPAFTIKGSQIGNNSVDSTLLKDTLDTELHIALGAVDSNALKDKNVDASHIPASTIVVLNELIADTTIEASSLDAGGISLGNPYFVFSKIVGKSVEKNSIDIGRIFDNGVDEKDIANLSIPLSKLNLTSPIIRANHFARKGIPMSSMAPYIIFSGSLLNSPSVKSVHIVDESIHTKHIQDGEIINPILNTQSVESQQLSTSLIISKTSNTPSATSILELQHSEKGFLLPQFTTGDASALGKKLNNTHTGMMILDTTARSVKIWNGEAWRSTGKRGGSEKEPLEVSQSLEVKEGEFFIFNNKTYGVIHPPESSLPDLLWLDRNLGADNVAQTQGDPLSYGDYYQWGRMTDGHQEKSSSTSASLVDNAMGYASTDFVQGSGGSAWFTSSAEPFLWAGVDAPNNPCPEGWRVASKSDIVSLGFNKASDYFNSSLKFPTLAGVRTANGAINSLGNNAFSLWLSDTTAVDGLPFFLSFDSKFETQSEGSLVGRPIRCVTERDPDKRVLSSSKLIGSVLTHHEFEYSVLDVGGTLWLDRNLGATQHATALNDPKGKGHKYQWGRKRDRHEDGRLISNKKNLTPTSTSTSFTLKDNGKWYEDGKGIGDKLWSTQDGNINNPCPEGWHVTTLNDWMSFKELFTTVKLMQSSPLALTEAGFRDGETGLISNEDHPYWTSTLASDTTAYAYDLKSGNILIRSINEGLPVRCVKSSSKQTPLDDVKNNWRWANEGDVILYKSIPYTVLADPSGTSDLLWLDKNIGASVVSKSKNDSFGFGHYYQWGRKSEGHQIPYTELTTTQVDIDVISNDKGDKFITNVTGEWSTYTDSTLWVGINSRHNPCPPGWRLPTTDELDELGFDDINQAASSWLAIAASGYRDKTGTFVHDDETALLWTSHYGQAWKYNNTTAEPVSRVVGEGLSVRCVTPIAPEKRVIAEGAREGETIEYLLDTYVVVRDKVDKLWLDRNLGSTKAASSYDDLSASGDSYQWGRRKDGHQNLSATTSNTVYNIMGVTSDDYVAKDSWFNVSAVNNNGDIWNGKDGLNNPCPPGWGVPTSTEWARFISNSSVKYTNEVEAFASPLKLSQNTQRVLNSKTNKMMYATSSRNIQTEARAFAMIFSETTASIELINTGTSTAVRCIKK